MVAHDNVDFLKCRTQSFHVGNCVVHRGNIGGRSVMVPVAQEYAGLTTFRFGLFYEPFHEVFTVIVVYSGITLQPKVYVCETSDFLKECHVLPFLLDGWFMIGHVYLVLEFDVLEIVLEIELAGLLEFLVQFRESGLVDLMYISMHGLHHLLV